MRIVNVRLHCVSRKGTVVLTDRYSVRGGNIMTAKKATVSTKKAAATVKANDPVKTAEPVKAETVKTEAAKTEAVKKEVVPVKKGEVVKKETAPVKAETVKTEAAPAAKKEAAKKETVKKAPAKKAPAKKAETVQKVYVQYGGKEILTSDLAEKATQIWVEMGHRASSIKSLELYVKPEDMAAYYVINGKDTGKIEL